MLQAERRRRKAIRRDLTIWATEAGFEPAAHHRLLLDHLSLLSDGAIDRLMVLMPPGSAKSSYASIVFPAWWFARHPSSSILAASHTAELAEHFGREVRALAAEHGPALGYTIAGDNRAARRWQTSRKGQYFATGVRGPLTGRRADLAIIDDPIRSHAEAEMPAFRDHLWNWFRSELVTRLKPRGRILLVMTRWHADDLAGRLLRDQPAQWQLLRLPALADDGDPLGRLPGDALWPEWEDAEALGRKRLLVGERAWAALFQQSPLPPGRDPFRIDRVAIIDALDGPSQGRVVRAWDLAATAQHGGNDPDWTVGLKLARDAKGRFVVLDVVRLRADPAGVEHAIRSAALRDGPDVIIGLPQDPGQAGKAQVAHLVALLAGCRVAASPEAGSKAARAEPVVSQSAHGNLALIEGAWNARFLDELRDFPDGSKDDQVDALSRAFALLTEGTTAAPARSLYVPVMAR